MICDHMHFIQATTLDKPTNDVKLAGIMRLEKDEHHGKRYMALRSSLAHLLSESETIETDKLHRNHAYVGTMDVREECQGFGLALCVSLSISLFSIYCER